MSRLTLTPHKLGAYKCSTDCVCQNGIWLIPCTDPICHTFPEGYLTGHYPPNYPVPSLIGRRGIFPECVVFFQPDDWTRNDPYLTFWNESYGLPLPSDHGVCNPDKPE